MSTRPLARHALSLAALVGLSAPHAHAQQNGYYPINATINTNTGNDAIVGYANYNDYSNKTNGTSPTVSLVTGGAIVNLQAENNSTVNVSGGNILQSMFAQNNSTVNFSGGSIGSYIFASDTSVLKVTGGSVKYDLYAYNNNTVTISGGNLGRGLFTYSASAVTISGGSRQYLIAYDSSNVTISGGSMSSNLAAGNSSNITISGGTFGKDNGINFVDQTTGIFTFVGSNLRAFNARPDTSYLGGTDYDLSGTLKSGTNLNGYVLNVKNGSSFNLQAVPETSTLVALPALLAALGAGLARKRRSRS